MDEVCIQRILTEYGTKLGKKINLRVMALIDPSARNPYEGMNIVYAPGMVHLTTEKLTELMREFEDETERFLKGIILKDESRVPRTIYISTNTRRIFIRLIRVPNKQFQLSKSPDKDEVPKENIYYLGLSVIKNMANVGKEMPEEKPQAVFDEMDLIVKDVEQVLSVL
jgi:hypothetical protein